MLFRLHTIELVAVVLVFVLAAAGLGHLIGRRLRDRSETLREPLAVLQGALLGVTGLILAFGLALAVGRYESRRSAVVADANAIGTTFLRAQTLAEPARSRSLELLKDYADTSIRLSGSVPGSPAARSAVEGGEVLQRDLWSLAGQALAAAPTDSAPRLYVETLNELIDMQTVRVSALDNRVPPPVLWLEVIAAAVAICLLAVYLALLGRGILAALLAGAFVSVVILVIFDLDRPTRGLIQVPDAPLVALRASMDLPPAAAPPS